MIIIGSLVTLMVFLVVGWAVTTEMLQHRHWRHRVESGDVSVVAALIEEAMAGWRRARPPRGVPSTLWAGVQAAQLVAVTSSGATISASAEGAFRTENGRRVQVTSALDEAIALAAKLVDMILYDVPNLRLRTARVDIYATFTGSDGTPVQQPILTTTADRQLADQLSWEALTSAEILGRFNTRYERAATGQARPIVLDPVEGEAPARMPAASGSSA